MCVDMGFMSVGCSSTTESNLKNETTLNTLTSILTEKSTTANNSAILAQDITISARGANIGAEINIIQDMRGAIKFVSNINDKQVNDILTDVSNVLTNNIKNMSAVETELFSKAANATTKTEVSNIIKNTLKNDAVVRSVTAIMNRYDVSQHLKIDLDGANITKAINLNQNMLLEIEASAIMSVVQQALLKNTTLATIASNLETQSKEKNTGLPAVLDSLAAMFTGPLMWIAIILIVAIIGMGWLLSKGAGKAIGLGGPEGDALKGAAAANSLSILPHIRQTAPTAQ